MCDMPTCYIHDLPKARTTHICCECGGTIRPGETYHRHHGVWDGRGATYKVCDDCERLREDWDRNLMESPTPFTYLQESILSAWPDGRTEILRLAEIVRRRRGKVDGWLAERAALVALGEAGR